jgi:outer membrane protein OmpA-like peptidoglycan-associated protein/tetratricopeptide (TPR) repeat protein
MKYIKYIWVTGLLLIATIGYAQTNKLKKADKKFEDLAYIDALKIYEELVDNGYEDAGLFMKLADSYYFNADYVEAAKWYGKFAALQADLPPENQFRYGQSLKAIGDYKGADILLKSFYQSQGIYESDSKVYLKEIQEYSDKYIANTVGFNTAYSDYPAFLMGEELYVISASSNAKKTPWNKEPTSDIFKLDGNSLTNLGNQINTKFNEGSLVITKDGKTMFFTRNDYNDKKKGADSNKTMLLKLYVAKHINGKWGNVQELPFNTSEYSAGHPALSPDGSKLYFVSDMPGNSGKGGTDIYEVDLYEDGTFGAAFNMAGFNTPGNEMFPYVAEDGTFYFASNGFVANLGGLDLYSSSTDKDGVFGKVVNLGAPINSAMDDFAMVMNSTTKKGYLASNRSGAKSDDIYSFVLNEDFIEPCDVVYKGVVRDQKTGAILENVLVSLVDVNNQIIAQKIAAEGDYEFEEMDCNIVKFVRVEKVKYQTGEQLIAIPIDGLAITDVSLVPRTLGLTEGTDLGLRLSSIYFDLDKSNIRPDAEIELQKIIVIMRNNPSLNIDVRSHTDSRAPDAYNMELSSRRAQSTLEYINRGGISRMRLSGAGFGEKQLKNECSNGVKCSKEEHQLNRRSEFIIIKK